MEPDERGAECLYDGHDNLVDGVLERLARRPLIRAQYGVHVLDGGDGERATRRSLQILAALAQVDCLGGLALQPRRRAYHAQVLGIDEREERARQPGAVLHLPQRLEHLVRRLDRLGLAPNRAQQDDELVVQAKVSVVPRHAHYLLDQVVELLGAQACRRYAHYHVQIVHYRHRFVVLFGVVLFFVVPKVQNITTVTTLKTSKF